MVRSLPLSSVAEIQGGFHAPKGINPQTDGTHFIIQARDIDKGFRVKATTLSRFFPERRPDSYLVSQGDVLFLARGAPHFAVLIDTPIKNTLASGAFHVLRPKVGFILPAFLAWWLNQPPAQSFLKSCSSGTNLPFLAKKQLEELIISVPEISTQMAVIRINQLFDREENLSELITKKRAKLASLACSALCGGAKLTAPQKSRQSPRTSAEPSKE